jgi:hypothetical protein
MLSMLDIKELIIARLDPLEFLDLLDIDFESLVDKCREEIKDNWDVVVEALRE